MSEMRNERRRRRLAGVRMGPDGLYRAQFKSLLGSVLDRLDWDRQNNIGKENYAKEVSKIYHGSSSYADSVLNRIDKSLSTYYFASIVLIPVTLILVYKLISSL